jgi:hypothetical protein
LIGRGELLTEIVAPPGKLVKEKFHPYSFVEAQRYIVARTQETAQALNALPAGACPGDQAVAIFTIHPSYLAKSYYPSELLKALDLRAIGSRAATIRVRNGTSRQIHKDVSTAELYVAGSRAGFANWSRSLATWSEVQDGAEQLRYLEDIYAEDPTERIRDADTLKKTEYIEVVLQMVDNDGSILTAFERFVETLRGEALVKKRQQIGGLCYLPVAIDPRAHSELAKFSFLRGMRRMPQLRSFFPFRATSATFAPLLPSKPALNPHLRVAVLDGGMPINPDLTNWVTALDADNIGAALAEAQEHGLSVTSALLFGPLEDGQPASDPLARVEHYRIADVGIVNETPDLYDVLPRVEQVLTSDHFDYVALCVGPTLNVDDSLVHAWTAKLDEILSHGKTLVFIAAGNTGHLNLPLQRIGPPADAVNALTIGACDSSATPWYKASYSSIGPGRSCGFVKPDIVAFGGEPRNELFGVLQAGTPLAAIGAAGTSYAAPNALRIALGAAARFGHALHPLTMKALLIHHAQKVRHTTVFEVGWGRVPSDYEQLIACPADAAHIVYQGRLQPGKYLRAPVPVPAKFGNHGPVHLTATICFATPTEPENTVSYTRAGLEVFFRPHANRRKTATQRYADTASFFRSGDLAQPEGTLRADALKWETTLKKSRRFDRPAALHDPVFDIHYVAREGGGGANDPPDIPYAMVVTVRQQGFAQLYDQIASRYRGVLEPLVPAIRVPLRIMPGES